MQKIDQLNVAAIVVAIVGSAVAVAIYEPDTGASDFTVSWPLAQFAVTGANEQHTGAGEIHVALQVPYRNVTTLDIEVEVVVAGPRVQAQTFTVDASGPGVGPASATGTVPAGATEARVTVTVPVEVAAIPTNETIRAADNTTALHRLNETSSSSVGYGVWDIAVTFSGTQRDAVAPETHAVNVRATASVWRAVVTPDVPDVGEEA